MRTALVRPATGILRGIGIIILFIILSVPAHAAGNTWFVRPSAVPGTYYLENGTDYSNAWNGFDSIDWTAAGVQPGDTLYICDHHYADSLTIKGSGSATEGPITIDGSCPGGQSGYMYGAKGVNNAITWIDIGNNLWATDNGTYDSYPAEGGRVPGWVLQVPISPHTHNCAYDVCFTSPSGTQLNGAAWWQPQPGSTTSGGMRPGRMVMSSDVPPYNLYSLIIIPHRYAAVSAVGKSHITVQNLVIQYVSTHGISMYAVSDIIVSNVDVSYIGGASSSVNAWTYPRAGNGISFHGDGTSNNMVTGCTVTQAFDVGLDMELYGSVRETAHDLIFENNTVDKCGGGISVNTHINNTTKALGCSDIGGVIKCLEIYNVTVRNNTFSNIGLGWSGTVTSNSRGHAINFQEVFDTANGTHSEVHGIVIEGNTVDRYTWAGILMNEGEAIIKGNVIINGTADYDNNYTNPAGIIIHGGDYGTDPDGYSSYEATGLITDNIIMGNDGHGVYIINNTPRPDGSNAYGGKLLVYNNTLYDNGKKYDPDQPYNSLGYAYSNFASLSSCGTEFKNNIVYSSANPDSFSFIAARVNNGCTTESDNNVFFRPSGTGDIWWRWGSSTYIGTQFGAYKSASGNDSSSFAEDPLFINLYNNYHLAPASPAVDTGSAVAGRLSDIEGNPVPCGPEPDIGAYEYCDSDGDGMQDAFEIQYGLNPDNNSDAGTDGDSDGLTNLQEFQAGTDPTDTDSDDDNIIDGADTCPLDPPMKIAGTSLHYATLQNAYSSAMSLDVIKCQASTIVESLTFDIDKAVTIDGGYDCGHINNTGLTSFTGNMTISNGTVTIGNFKME